MSDRLLGAASGLAETLAGVSLAAAAVVAGCALLAALWRRLPPRLLAALWWLAALRILLELSGAPGVRLALLPAAPVRASEVDAIDAPLAAARDAAHPVGREAAPTPRLSGRGGVAALGAAETARAALALAWIAGLALGAASEAFRWLRLAGVVRRARAAAPVEWIQARDAAASALGLGRLVPLLVSDEIATPMVVGLLRPRLLLPADARLGGEELRLVLLHELAHVARRDALAALVPALARRLFWFHPPVRFAEREYRLAAEAACDALALARAGAEPRRYGRLLVRFAAAPEAGALAAQPFAQRPLERRLRMLASTPLAPREKALAAPALGLVALALALPVRLVAAPAPPPAPAVPALRAVAAPPAPAAPPALAAAPARPAAPAVPEVAVATARLRVRAVAAAPPAPPTPPAPPAHPAPPAPPAAPAAPRPLAAPAPPAPPEPPEPPVAPNWSRLDPGEAVVFLDGDTTVVVNASAADRRAARALAEAGEPVVLVRRDGVRYVVRDPVAIEELRGLVEEATAFERERGDAAHEAAERARAEAERLRARIEEELAVDREELEARARELAERAAEISERARASAERARASARREAERAAELAREHAARSIESARQIEESRRVELERGLGREVGRSFRASVRALRDLLDELFREGRVERLPK